MSDHERTQKIAYEIWEKMRKPSGHDHIIWEMAEKVAFWTNIRVFTFEVVE